MLMSILMIQTERKPKVMDGRLNTATWSMSIQRLVSRMIMEMTIITEQYLSNKMDLIDHLLFIYLREANAFS